MFKDLNKLFDKKKAIINNTSDKSQEIKREVSIFLKTEFGDKIEGFSFIISYNSKDNNLIITSENKVLANELIIRLVALTDFLQSRNIRLSKILIR